MVLARRWAGRLASTIVAAATAATVATTGVAANDYPTETRVDYVLACMASNGEDYLVMRQCSCSIDTIADVVPYEDYERIETIMRMRERRGELGVLFRSSPGLEEEVQTFKEAQVEADLQCF